MKARAKVEAAMEPKDLQAALNRLAQDELAAGRPDPARVVLEGVVVADPRCIEAWTLLAQAHLALNQPLASRFCGEVAKSLAGAAEVRS